jgi:hypothetical protein
MAFNEPKGDNVVIYDKNSSELWAIYDNGTRLLVEMQKKYTLRPKQVIEETHLEEEDVEENPEDLESKKKEKEKDVEAEEIPK